MQGFAVTLLRFCIDRHSLQTASPAILPSQPNRTREADLGALCEHKRLIDNQFLKDGAPMSVFLWRLGSNMFLIIGHTGCRRTDFAKLAALKFSASHCQLFPPTTFVIITNKQCQLYRLWRIMLSVSSGVANLMEVSATNSL